jgi:SAM-dependent methyltransferase
LFHLGRPLPLDACRHLFPPGLAERLVEAGVLLKTGARLRSAVMITPLDNKLYFSDPLWLRRHREYVYMGRTSMLPRAVLDGLKSRAPGGRLLDLGCGAGILGISVASAFDQVVGTDILARCLHYARLNAALNGAANCSFRHSDLYSQVDGTFDVILSNPPCGWVEEDEEPKLFSHGGDDYGTELPAQILAGAHRRLRPEGRVVATLTCPMLGKRAYVREVMERLYRSRPMSVALYPLQEEFSYRRARTYRREGITKFVRYLAVIEPSDRFRLQFKRLDSLRLLSYRARTLVPRLAAALTGGPSSSVTR